MSALLELLLIMHVSVSSGAEETKRRVCTCGNRSLLNRGQHHRSGVSLPHGLALGMGLHPWVNTALTLHLSIFFILLALETDEPLKANSVIYFFSEFNLHSLTIYDLFGSP